MPKSPSQIQADLEAIAADIPEFIKTGIPANVKSDNHRSLETRSNTAAQDILEHIVAFYANMGMVINGFGDPNVYPPTEDYGTGQLFQEQNMSTNENLALWIYTGVDGIGWWKFENFNSGVAKKYYADITDPNSEVIPNLPSANPFKIGDFYVRTSTGTSAGDVISVWMFLGLATGDQWINLVSTGGSAGSFIDMSDTPASYTGQAGKIPKVKSDETGLEFSDPIENLSDTATGVSVDGGVGLSDFGGTPVNGFLYRTGNQLKFQDGAGNIHILNNGSIYFQDSESIEFSGDGSPESPYTAKQLHVYSTTEQPLNEYWIDERRIYEITFTGLALEEYPDLTSLSINTIVFDQFTKDSSGVFAGELILRYTKNGEAPSAPEMFKYLIIE